MFSLKMLLPRRALERYRRHAYPTVMPAARYRRVEDTELYVTRRCPTFSKGSRIDALGYEPIDDAPGQFATALRNEIATLRSIAGGASSNSR